MRTSTIAALLVAGGTIAALPFRRFSADMDPDAEATGPASDLLSHSTVSESAFSHRRAATQDTFHSTNQTRLHPARETVAENQAVSQPSRSRGQSSGFADNLFARQSGPWDPQSVDDNAQRHVEMPLTFDDLMLPIDRPKPIAEQFTAVMKNEQRTSVAGARASPSQSDSMRPLEPDPSSSRFGRLDQPNDRPLEPDLPPPVAGTFASSRVPVTDEERGGLDLTGQMIDRPPMAPPPVVRDRQWIRQPGSR